MINNLAPSYKAICIAIMKNDFQFQMLGFSKEKCAAYSSLKKIEISQRHEILQLDMFNG
jgi:predicted phosphoadenosine phosphosulfate sulfurtransferase